MLGVLLLELLMINYTELLNDISSGGFSGEKLGACRGDCLRKSQVCNDCGPSSSGKTTTSHRLAIQMMGKA